MSGWLAERKPDEKPLLPRVTKFRLQTGTTSGEVLFFSQEPLLSIYVCALVDDIIGRRASEDTTFHPPPLPVSIPVFIQRELDSSSPRRARVNMQRTAVLVCACFWNVFDISEIDPSPAVVGIYFLSLMSFCAGR